MKNCSRCGRLMGDYEYVCPQCGYNFYSGADSAVPQYSPYEIPFDPNRMDFQDDYNVNSRQPNADNSADANYNSPQKNKTALIALGITSCLLVVIIAVTSIMLISSGSKQSGGGGGGGGGGGTTVRENRISDKTQVPDVEGFQLDVAEDKLSNAGFGWTIEYREAENIVNGLVIEQTPKPYNFAEKNTKVRLVVSKSSVFSEALQETEATVRVPNVVGLPLEDAVQIIKDNSLVPCVSGYEYSSTVPEGHIISQDPEGGDSDSYTAKENSSVMLVVSKGEDMSNYVKLEDYTGRDINDVKKELEGAGLKVAYQYVESDTYPVDAIISQDTPKDTYVEKGKTVNFEVSEGKKQVTSSESTSKGKPIFHNVMASSTLKPESGYTYDVTNALHDDDTCWSEGISGVGVGEYIMLYDSNVQTVKGCQIVNGYARDKTVFNNNSRMSKVTFEFSDGSTYTTDIDPDRMDLQTIEFPNPVQTTSLKIIIADAKSGDKYDDTCITLIMPY